MTRRAQKSIFGKMCFKTLISLALILILPSPLPASGRPGRQISDEELMEKVQRQTFRYFWDYAYPGNGMIRERSRRTEGLVPFDSSYFVTEKGPQGIPGLRGDYFNNTSFMGEPVFSRVDETIDMEWGRGSPDPRIRPDRFSIRWQGFMKFPRSGYYEIGLGSDDGSRLYFNGNLLIDNWGDHSYKVKSGGVEVEAGKLYPVKLEYYENVQEASVRLGLMKEYLSPDAPVEKDLGNIICAVGGTGMGVMAIIVGAERGWVEREEAALRVLSIVEFLEEADSYHGAFPHWLDAQTGRTIAFSREDDGADIMETALLFQGLLSARAYFNRDMSHEKNLREKITNLWNKVQWNFFTRGEDVLYWHWSPNHGWAMGHKIRGWDECLIAYVLAASSLTDPIDPKVYHQGYADNVTFVNGKEYYGIELPLGPDYGGPLFFAHYSFLGLDPRGLEDRYAEYWVQNVNHTLINREHCIQNPNNYKGYGPESWGLTSSYNYQGYDAHSPALDMGVITPTAALSSMPYTPRYSIQALRHFYYEKGDKLWSRFGFVDAFSTHYSWRADTHLAINQAPIIIMIENYRSGLLWDIFMGIPEVRDGLKALGFNIQ